MMRIPARLTVFRFPGYGPDLSQALAVLTQGRRVVLADALFNPGTSLTNAIEIAIPAALQSLGVPDDLPVYQWTPTDPLKPNTLWRVEISPSGEPIWTEEAEWAQDPDLVGAIDALTRAGATVP